MNISDNTKKLFQTNFQDSNMNNYDYENQNYNIQEINDDYE